MPWHLLELPSLALGILEQIALRTLPAAPTAVVYANITWAEYIFEQTQGSATPQMYSRIAQEGIGCSMGDWVFAPALHGIPAENTDFFRYLSEKSWDIPSLVRLRHLSSSFIANLANQLCAEGVTVAALSSTFMQNVAALALAKQLKLRNASITTVMGGANCDGVQGIALHRNFAFIDYIIRGEGEYAFAELLKFLNGEKDRPDIPGVCYRGPSGESVSDRNQSHPVPLKDTPQPRFTAYRIQLDACSIRKFIQTKAVVETSRGCWWGEKQHCAFCGLNGEVMQYRAKPMERVVQDINAAVSDCVSLDVFTVDNILDFRFASSLLPQLIQIPYDCSLHFEIKSNITLEQLLSLRRAKVNHVQPGIESLISRVLKLMRKGVTGWQNVRCLRDCQSVGMTATWNILYGFPGETPEEYADCIARIPLLFHLQPPAEVIRFSVQRFSPYFDEPWLGFVRKQPARFFEEIYRLGPKELNDLVYLFEVPFQGIAEDTADHLRAAVDEWREYHQASTLQVESLPDRLIVTDTRPGFQASGDCIEGRLASKMYEVFRSGRQLNAAARVLQQTGDVSLTEPDLRHTLNGLLDRGLLYRAEDGVYLSLGIETTPYSTQ